MEDQRVAMRFSTLVLSARSKAGIRVRQPLAMVHYQARDEREKGALGRVVQVVNANTNVKSYDFDDVAKWVTLPDISVAEEAGSGVALETVVTPDLADEGLAREIVHRLQTMRRNAGFDIADYITTHYQGDAEIARVLRRFEDYVRQETLSRELVEGPPPPDAYVEEHKISGKSVRLAVQRLRVSG
jgi:isoleucyl-tRNA synthetase